MIVIKHNSKYRRIANKLIRGRPELSFIKELGIRIAYLESDKEKKKNKKIILADCTKVDEKYSWCCDYDFFITVYTPNVADLNDEQLEILILHELYHVGVDNDGDEPKPYIVPHDVEEFDRIIDEYGLYWDRGVVDG